MSDAARIMQYDASKKSVGVAYALWFFFGMFGAHRFYLSQSGTAAAILVITVFSFFLMIVGIGFFTIWIAVVWVFVDLFLIPGMTQRYNTDLASRIPA